MLKEYFKRLTICILGLMLYALGNFFGLLAGSAGTNGWNTMALGLSNVTGISFGNGAGCGSSGHVLSVFSSKKLKCYEMYKIQSLFLQKTVT